MADLRIHLNIRGIVQGVGFRPFLHRLTEQYSLSGWARNTSAGVELELEGDEARLAGFLRALEVEKPPLAVIRSVDRTELPSTAGETGFQILTSSVSEREALVSPDVGLCPDCLRELKDPADRRHRYPFLNCTNCGPRFTIVKDVPYDRERTSMAAFPMCPPCDGEYHDVRDRRYHAQPTCCPDCGPALSWLDENGQPVTGEPLDLARASLQRGGIIAVKGLGAFHLACLPTAEAAARLRQRKHRDEKPFALMCRDMDAVRSVCYVNQEEEQLLTSRRKPIVLLRKKPDAPQGLSDNSELGLMLPYTPLHHLLTEDFPLLVMTSANLSDLPAIVDNHEAVTSLKGVADGFLLHNRDIITRCDDSLMRVFRGVEYPLRRSRGYAPQPIFLDEALPPILACGGEQKAAFCLSRDHDAFLSQHIGDLKNAETLEHYEHQIAHFQRLFGIRPAALVCDLHPDYLSTLYAQNRAKQENLPLLQVQHHHAHMVSCMADNGLTEPCIGLIWDGTGCGSDGTVWGGECLSGDAKGFVREGSILPVPLPGGDLCTKEIGRTAHALLWTCGQERFSPLLPDRTSLVTRQLKADLNCPRSSGMGRLFDGVYALLTGRNTVTYEGQGAILLEAMADEVGRSLPLSFYEEEGVLRLDWRPTVAALMEEKGRGTPPEKLASAFMNTLIEGGLVQCRSARRRTGLTHVVLSGGVFQNMYLLPRMLDALRAEGFLPHHHCRVACNDEGISLGQLMIANAQRKDV